jgi:penicillin G amidase
MTDDAVYEVEALTDPVEILVDVWGVPHIYAQSDHDLYLAQGFAVARDRMFQIDLWRRRGLGKLAAVLGETYLEQDRANRLLLFRGDMDAEWASYGESARDTVSAFVAGINAYISWASAEPARLAPEFHAHDYVPETWEPEDVVRIRTHGLFGNVEGEVARTVMVRDAGLRAERIRLTREPADVYQIPDAATLELISEDILATYRKAFTPVSFVQTQVADKEERPGDGSNNWVIAPSRSATGRPIVANDPHRVITLPSLRYIVHLESPTTSLIGGGEPAVPGVSIGHNGQVGFGLTIGSADQEDLYVYELDPARPGQYRYGDSWEPFTTVPEVIEVARGEPRTVDLTFSRHGPIIHTDPERNFAVAVRAAWLEPGMAPYLGSLRYAGASNVEEFRDALRHWGAPSVNQVFADTNGDIAWQHSARVPKRPNWDGGFPVPGGGEFEWAGYADIDELPHSHNPAAGWFTSSNEMNMSADYDNQALTITYDWPSPARHRRLAEWLGSDAPIGIDESAAMQFDTHTIEGRKFAAQLATIDTTAFNERELFQRLQQWDGDASADSAEALLFEVWVRRHLRPWLIERYFRPETLPPQARERILSIANRDESLGSDLRGDWTMYQVIVKTKPAEEVASAINSTFDAAVAEIEQLLGPDRARWSWGAVHHCYLENPALAPWPDAPGRSVGPLPRGGTGDSVQLATYDRNFRMVGGSTFRVVIDVGNWDNSRAANAPGQSADPRSPHYDDLFNSWCAGETFPLCYSRPAVERQLEYTITLEPKR